MTLKACLLEPIYEIFLLIVVSRKTPSETSIDSFNRYVRGEVCW